MFHWCCIVYYIICWCGRWNMWHHWLLVKGLMQWSFWWIRSGEFCASVSGKENILCVCRVLIVDKMSRYATALWFRLPNCWAILVFMRPSNFYGGATLHFIKPLDKSPRRTGSVQYPFSLTPLQFEQLLHQPSFNVLGKSDIISMLRTCRLHNKILLDERWVQSTEVFRRVKLFNKFGWRFMEFIFIWGFV